MKQVEIIEENNKNEGSFRRSFVFWLILAAALAGFDQLNKWLAFNTQSLIFLDGLRPVLGFQKFLNRNFAFSIPLPQILIFFVYIIVGACIAYHLFRNFTRFNRAYFVAWALICAGGVSNVTERIALGHVRDFIYIASAVFNLADLYIIAGILILLSTPSLKANS